MSIEIDYKQKYLKYKNKYLELKHEIYGGGKLTLEKRGNMGFYLLTFKDGNKILFTIDYNIRIDNFFNYIPDKNGNPSNNYILDFTNLNLTKTDKKGKKKEINIDKQYKKKYNCKKIRDIVDSEYNFTFPGPLEIYELTEIKEETKK